MPTVPSQDNFKVAPTIGPAPMVKNTRSLAEAQIPGAQLEQAGRARQNAGQQLANQQIDILNEANALRVADAENLLQERAMRLKYDKEQGYERFTGYDALQRPNGIPLADEFTQQLSQASSEIEATLGNDAQKRMFYERSQNIQGTFKNQAIQYEGAQFREYSKSVREGTIKNRTQEIALNYDNPEIVSRAIADIDASARDLARQLGKSAEYGDAAAKEAMSAGHMVVIETSLAKGNALYADNYFKQNAKSMSANDILRVNATLSGEFDKQFAQSMANKVMTEQRNNIVTPDSDRAFNITIGAESSGMQFGGPGSVKGPNEPTTSPKGAIGIAQVMPGTGPEAAKLAGVEWDEQKFKNDPAYNRSLGKAYFEKQLKDFNGNLAQAYAAYNAGPGAVRKALETAAQSGEKVETVSYDAQGRETYSYGPKGDPNWLQFLPKETQDYVTKNVQAFGVGGGKSPRPTLVELQNQVKEQMSNENPTRLRLALDEVERQYDDLTKSLAAEREQYKTDAMREVMANGGDFAALPSQMRANLDPEDVVGVMDFAKRISKGTDETNLWLYNKFESNPQALTALSDNQFFALRAEMNEADFKYFSKKRADMLNGTLPESQDPGSLNSQAIKNAVDTRLRMIGFDPSPEEETDDAKQVGSIRKFINDSLLDAQRANNKKFNDADTITFIDDLFARQTDSAWYSSKTNMLTFTTSDIPPSTRRNLKDMYRGKFGVDPSDADLLNMYWQQTTRSGKQKARCGGGTY